jgi:hypothetical protein
MDESAPVSRDQARAQLALAGQAPQATARDRRMVAASITGSVVAMAVFLVWLVPLVVQGDGRRSLVLWLFYAAALITFNFIRTHTRSTPYDTGRLSSLLLVLELPAIGVGLLVANLPAGPSIARQLLAATIIALPSLVIGARILRGPE